MVIDSYNQILIEGKKTPNTKIGRLFLKKKMVVKFLKVHNGIPGLTVVLQKTAIAVFSTVGEIIVIRIYLWYCQTEEEW